MAAVGGQLAGCWPGHSNPLAKGRTSANGLGCKPLLQVLTWSDAAEQDDAPQRAIGGLFSDVDAGRDDITGGVDHPPLEAQESVMRVDRAGQNRRRAAEGTAD